MDFTYKGVRLTMNDMQLISKHYEICCTAEYLMNNYPVTTQSQAFELATEIRRQMDKYGYDEEEAAVIVWQKEYGD